MKRPQDVCKYVIREGEGCPKNNKCRYPDCAIEQLQEKVGELKHGLSGIILSIACHPDCEEGSEFDDMVNIGRDILDRT